MTNPEQNICIFEDDLASNFSPLVYARPVFDLRCGIYTLREKIQSYYPNVPCRLWCRDELSDLLQEQNPDIPVNTMKDSVTLYINGRVLMDKNLARVITLDGPDCIFSNGDTLIAARVQDSQWPILLSGSSASSVVRATTEQVEVQARMVHYLWDLIRLNSEEIEHDFSRLNVQPADTTKYPNVHFINEHHIMVDASADILPGSVIDASDGPVLIGPNARILPQAYIQGPVSIGEQSTVQPGAYIYGGTTVGPVCKVGGEVASSIIQGYSNKQHHGFLGHAYLGQWINLGAGTTNSNLKNTYGTITMDLNGKKINTDMTFLGLLMGDYSKAAINTVFNTGTMVGFSSNVVNQGFPPKYIPSFSWYTPSRVDTFQLTKALEVAQRMMARRKKTMSPTETGRFVQIYGDTAQERSKMADAESMR